MASIGYDGTFELNEFNEPKLASEIEVVKNIILTVLFFKPGQYPSLPTIGGLSAYIFALLACVFALVAAVLALDIASSDEDTISLNSVTI